MTHDGLWVKEVKEDREIIFQQNMTVHICCRLLFAVVAWMTIWPSGHLFVEGDKMATRIVFTRQGPVRGMKYDLQSHMFPSLGKVSTHQGVFRIVCILLQGNFEKKICWTFRGARRMPS